MSRADLRFLLKVIALVLLVVAGGVIAGFKIFAGGPDPVSLDCEDLAAEASSGVTYPVAEPVLERQTSDSARWCEFAGVGPDGTRDVVRVTVERFEGAAPSTVDGCAAAVEFPVRDGRGCLTNVDGAGTPGANGAIATIVLASGDLRVQVDARMSAVTLTRLEGLAVGAGQGLEAFVLADLARFAEAARELAGQ
ncbi:hypothetical protein [Phytomonospora endophytica]|uniref:Uncharacterized protein n=1 Tax=Phytomonospora endophytica TaxID=714109 RepID=A0A841FGC2_9ACTN|nr:hypothetical protein [Phytomonospora endophytica]MBB6036381.1 hypothetical protein [Phytomonospora endophytica]GIG65702.1 hypothetical protein Pen01_19970 [Phytomonospora endophytica]